jgi:hypothetical protein
MRCALVHSARRRVEGQRGGDGTAFRSSLRDRAQDCLMAEVNAVEVANGENAAASRRTVVGRPFFRVCQSDDFGGLRGTRGRDSGAGSPGRVHRNVELQAVVGQRDILESKFAKAFVGFRVR